MFGASFGAVAPGGFQLFKGEFEVFQLKGGSFQGLADDSTRLAPEM